MQLDSNLDLVLFANVTVLTHYSTRAPDRWKRSVAVLKSCQRM